MSIRAVVLMIDPASLTAFARFCGSVSAGLCTRRPLVAASFAAPEAARCAGDCRLAALTGSSYRDRQGSSAPGRVCG
jgi:hypothetical protein